MVLHPWFERIMGVFLIINDNFNTANVEYIDCMFYGCSKLTELDLSSFTFKNNVSLYYMFEYLGKETNDGTTVLVKDEATKTYLEGKKDSLGYGKYTITVPTPCVLPDGYIFNGSFDPSEKGNIK